MRKVILMAAAAAFAAISLAQAPIHARQGHLLPKEKPWSAELKRKSLTAKPVFVNMDTVESRDIVFGITNPDLEEIGSPTPPKPGGKQAQTLTADAPNLFADASAYVTGYDSIDGTQTGLVPPDTDAAVGNGYVVTVINSRYEIARKDGTITQQGTFASLLGSPYNGYFLFDPKVIFDPWNDRYVMVIHARQGADSRLIVFISDDGNPNGGWWYYNLDLNLSYSGNLSWADYYDLGYGAQGVYLGGNQFRNSDNAFMGSCIVTLKKSDIYAALGTTYFRNTSAGTSVFAPRVADALVGPPQGADCFFTGLSFANRLGGSAVTLQRINDPFGANTLTTVNIGVGGYAVAPTAFQPGGNWFGFDCRMIEARMTYDYTRSKWHLYTGSQINVGGVMGLRMIDLNPTNNTLSWETNFWYGAGWCLSMPAPIVDYRGTCSWVHSYASNAGGGTFPSLAWATFDDNAYIANGLARGGSSNSGSGRWGDYAGGNMDWDDSANQGFTNPVKLWHYGEFMIGGGTYSSHVFAVTSNNASAGLLTATSSNPVSYTGVGGVGTYNGTVTLGNSGQVGLEWVLQSNSSWISPTNSTSGTLYAGQTYGASFSTNANANSLPYGRHTATATFRNIYSGATVVRNVLTLSLGYWICPDPTIFMYSGTPFVGDGSDLCVSDNNYFSLFCDDFTYVSDFFVQYSGVIDGSEYAYNYVEASAERGGLALQRFMWNSDGGGWILIGGSVCPTTDTGYFWGSGQGNANPFVHPSGWAWSRIRTEPINDEDPSQDGWLTNVDYNVVWTYP